jgi:hypothetical protein
MAGNGCSGTTSSGTNKTPRATAAWEPQIQDQRWCMASLEGCLAPQAWDEPGGFHSSAALGVKPDDLDKRHCLPHGTSADNCEHSREHQPQRLLERRKLETSYGGTMVTRSPKERDSEPSAREGCPNARSSGHSISHGSTRNSCSSTASSRHGRHHSIARGCPSAGSLRPCVAVANGCSCAISARRTPRVPPSSASARWRPPSLRTRARWGGCHRDHVASAAAPSGSS